MDPVRRIRAQPAGRASRPENECRLNLAVAAISLWNTVYLGRAADELRSRGETMPDELLAHIAPLGWEHIAFNGDYVWPAEPLVNAFRPLRNPPAGFLDSLAYDLEQIPR